MRNYSFIVALFAGLGSALPAAPVPCSDSTVPVASPTPVVPTVPAASSIVPSALPTPPVSSASDFDGSIILGNLSAEQIVGAAPKSASCASPIFTAEECSTATVAAPLLNEAFEKYGQTSLGQIAALIGLMAFESADFQANINHFPAPGRPGQGTKALLMFNFVYEYAYAQPELQDQVLQLSGGTKLSLTFDTISTVPESTQKSIRALVLPDEYTFGAASWFLSTQCDPSFASELSTGGHQAFANYIEKCIDAGAITEDRTTKWCEVVNALKPADMASPTGC